MVSQLLDRSLPQQLAERRQVIDCTVKFQDFQRLVEIVESDLAMLPVPDRPAKWREADVHISLSFGFTHAGDVIPVIDGEVSTALPAVCQRCLDPCSLQLTASMRYKLVAADSEQVGNDDYEIWELDDKTVRPLDFVEETLIMAMPYPALHESEDQCGPLAKQILPEPTKTVRPFADLKAQLDGSK